MLKTVLIAGFAFALFGSSTFVSAQQTQTQTGTPAQPTPSVFNRMRRFPSQQEGQNQQQDQQQQTVQTQQFPGQQQFPPEQRGPGFQRPGMNFPHAQGPEQQQTPPQPNPQVTNAPPAQQPPLAPYGLALKPATPPRISFTGGQLTVTADNCSLTDILSHVMKITGARLEGTRPPESDRVFGQFGPGTPRDVLNSLLTGSHYDYILIGGLDDPGEVRQVLLSLHGSALQGAATAGNQAANQPNSEEQEQENQENNEPAVIAQPEPPPPPTANNPSNPGQQQQVKTPEQLLQELQRLRQQQDSNPH